MPNSLIASDFNTTFLLGIYPILCRTSKLLSSHNTVFDKTTQITKYVIK